MFYTNVEASLTKQSYIDIPTEVISSVSLKSVLNINQTITFEGVLNGLIPREHCSDIQYMCMDVEPSKYGSTFSRADSLNTACKDIRRFMNCDGEFILKKTFNILVNI